MSKMNRVAVFLCCALIWGLWVTALFARPQCGGSQFAPCEKVFNACFNEQEFGSYRPLGGVCSDWNDCICLTRFRVTCYDMDEGGEPYRRTVSCERFDGQCCPRF